MFALRHAKGAQVISGLAMWFNTQKSLCCVLYCHPPGDFLWVSGDILVTAVTLLKGIVKHVFYINIHLGF